MLRTVNGQPTLWETVIPERLLPLPGDLARVDVWLDDPRFFEPLCAGSSTPIVHALCSVVTRMAAASMLVSKRSANPITSSMVGSSGHAAPKRLAGIKSSAAPTSPDAPSPARNPWRRLVDWSSRLRS